MRKYIKKQEEADKRIDQMKLFQDWPPIGGAWFYNRFERFTNNPQAFPEITLYRGNDA